MKKNANLLIVILVAILAGGTILFFQKKANNEIKPGSYLSTFHLHKTTKKQKNKNEQKITKNDSLDIDKTNTDDTNSDDKKNTEVEWLIYKDKDITFKYPKTFTGTNRQGAMNRVEPGGSWKVSKKENIIYIKPDFDLPATGSDFIYKIVIFDNTWQAEKEFNKIAALHPGPEQQWGKKLSIVKDGYYIGLIPKISLEKEEVFDVYFLVPGGIDSLGKSKKPQAKHFIVYAINGSYDDYVKNILIPSIDVK